MKYKSKLVTVVVLTILVAMMIRSYFVTDQLSLGNFQELNSFTLYDQRRKGFPTWPPRESSVGSVTLFSFRGIVYFRYELRSEKKADKQSKWGWRSDSNQIAMFSLGYDVTHHSAKGGSWHIMGFTLPYWFMLLLIVTSIGVKMLLKSRQPLRATSHMDYAQQVQGADEKE